MSPSSIIWYRPRGSDLFGLESNRGPGGHVLSKLPTITAQLAIERCGLIQTIAGTLGKMVSKQTNKKRWNYNIEDWRNCILPEAVETHLR